MKPSDSMRYRQLMPHTNRNRLLLVFAWCCLGITIIVATYVIFVAYKFGMNSDAAQKAMIAHLAIRDGTPIPRNWVYANGDLWITGPQLFTTILYPLLGMSFSLVASADWACYLFMLFTVYGVCRVIYPIHRLPAITATSLAAGGLSIANYDFVIGQAFYSIYPALAIGVFALTAQSSRRILAPSILTGILVASASILICITNASRGLVTIIVPLLAGWIAAQLIVRGPSPLNRIRSLINPTILCALFGAVAGVLLYKLWLIPNIINSSGAASYEIASPSMMAHNLLIMPRAWFHYFQIGGDWQSLSLLLRTLQCIVWIIACLLAVVPIWIVLTPKHRDSVLVVFGWITLAAFAVVVTALVASKTLFVSYLEFRYATPAIYASLCLLAVEAHRVAERLHGPSLVIGLFIIPIATILVWKAPNRGFVDLATHENLISALENAHVGTVLATYWNSHVLTVLSDGKIYAYPTKLVNGAQLVRFGQNEPTTISYGLAGKNQAIALTSSEVSNFTWPAIENEFGFPLKKIESGPFEIWIYDHDVAKKMYAVGFHISKPVSSRDLRIRIANGEHGACRGEDSCFTTIAVTNLGTSVLSSAGAKPLRLGILGLNSSGEVVNWNLGRIDFPLTLAPTATEHIRIRWPSIADMKVVSYRLCLLQELVAWHCDRTEMVTTGSAPAEARPDDGVSQERFQAKLVLAKRPTLTAGGEDILITLRVENTGAATFGSRTPPSGVNLGAHAVDASGTIVDNDLARGHLAQIAPGTSTLATILLPVENVLGRRAAILPVAENVGWFDVWGNQSLVIGPFVRCGEPHNPAVCVSNGQSLRRISESPARSTSNRHQ